MYSSKQAREQAVNFLNKVAEQLPNSKVSNADTVKLYYYPKMYYMIEVKESKRGLYCKVDKAIVSMKVDKVLGEVHRVLGIQDATLF